MASITELFRNEGNDTFVISGNNDQSDKFDGGAGTDTIRVAGTGAVTLATVVEEAETAGLSVRIAHVPPHAQRILTGVFGPDRLERLAAGPSA